MADIGLNLSPAMPVMFFNPGTMRVGDSVPFVAERFRFFLEPLTSIDQHHPSTVVRGLFVSQQPEVCEDAGIIK